MTWPEAFREVGLALVVAGGVVAFFYIVARARHCECQYAITDDEAYFEAASEARQDLAPLEQLKGEAK